MGFEEQPPDDTSKEYRNAEEPIEHHGSGEMYNVDPEKLAANDSTELPQLQRRLKSRHLQMIAIGGTIGTGLFIGSGTAIAHAGPVGAFIAYMFVGTLVYSVMTALGEMATYIPISGAYMTYAARFVDPSLGFAMGWICWFSWAINFALELTATGLIIQYWDHSIPISIFIAIFWVLVTFFNLLPVNFYGEMEFWLSSIKVVTIVGFILFSICINAGAGQEGYLGFRYWVHPGPFASYLVPEGPTARFVGFWAVLIQADFSYQGTELVGLAAAETENPRKTVPAAIRTTFIRIILFFVMTIFFIGILVPSNNKDLLSGDTNATASPFVIAAKLAGVKVLPSIINAVLLTVVLSAANSNVYSGSRILAGLAQEGFAPRWVKKTTARGVPYYSVAITAAFGLLGFLNVSSAGGMVFSWLLNICGVAGFITWATLIICHIAFMRALKARNVSRDMLPYKAMWQPYLSWYGLCVIVLITLTQGFTAWIPTFDASKFFVAYISLILFTILYFGHKAIYRTSFIRPIDADLDTGRLQIESMYWETSEPATWYGKVWNFISG